MALAQGYDYTWAVDIVALTGPLAIDSLSACAALRWLCALR
jgi:hypothetical protein